MSPFPTERDEASGGLFTGLDCLEIESGGKKEHESQAGGERGLMREKKGECSGDGEGKILHVSRMSGTRANPFCNEEKVHIDVMKAL